MAKVKEVEGGPGTARIGLELVLVPVMVPRMGLQDRLPCLETLFLRSGGNSSPLVRQEKGMKFRGERQFFFFIQKLGIMKNLYCIQSDN